MNVITDLSACFAVGINLQGASECPGERENRMCSFYFHW